MRKAILLDFGGVILNLDYAKLPESFSKLGVENIEEQFTQAKQSELVAKFEQGEIDEIQFREELRVKFNIKKTITDAQIDVAWNAMLLDLPEERVVLIENLKKQGHKLYLYSNINPLHLEYCRKNYGNVFVRLENCFEKCYYSFEFGYRKPDVLSYIEVLKDAGLDPKDVLFIDDSMQHVEGANQASINAVHLDVRSGEKFEEQAMQRIYKFIQPKAPVVNAVTLFQKEKDFPADLLVGGEISGFVAAIKKT